MVSLAILAEREKNQVRITDIQVYKLKEHAIQSIIRVKTSAGIEGIGEAGLPANVVQGYLDFMRDRLIGMDALEIEKCYAEMTRMQAQWHAHWVQNPTVSGIENALYDIAGKVFNTSVSKRSRAASATRLRCISIRLGRKTGLTLLAVATGLMS